MATPLAAAPPQRRGGPAAGAPHPAARAVRLRRRRCRGRGHAAPQRGGLRRGRAAAAPALRQHGPRPAPDPVRPRDRHAADRRDPPGLSGLLWPDGELATARAAAAAGIPYCLSHGSTCTIEALAETGSGAALDAGVHVPRPRAHPLLRRARAGRGLRRAGADHRQPGPGQPRARPPQRLLDPAAAHRPDHARHGGAARLAVAHARPARPDLRQLRRCRRRPAHRSRAGWRACSTRVPPGPTSPGCAALWPGPLLLKGVLHPDEARRAVAEGIDGIVVSNHGGRQLDGAPATHRRAARDRRRRRRAHPGPGRRRRAPRRRHRPRPRAGRHRLPDRPPASMGPRRRRRGRASPPCSSIYRRRARPGHGPVRLATTSARSTARPCAAAEPAPQIALARAAE